MFKFSLGRKRGKIIAVADIGSGSVAFAIAATSRGKPSRVLFAERSILPFEERTRDATITGLGQHLEETGKKMMTAYTASGAKAPIDALYCIVRAPWSRSRGVRVQEDLKEPTVVTAGIISELAKRALAAETELDKKNLLEAMVVKVELNGYETAEPEKKVAHSVAVCALLSDCDPALRALIQEKLRVLAPQVKPQWRSATRALLSEVRDMSASTDDRFIVEVVTEGTNMTVVREGVVAGQRIVEEGVRAILARLTPGGMGEETLALMRMLENEQCTSPACEALRVSMAKIEPELVRVFGEGMAALGTARRLPNKVLLVAHPDMLPWLSKFFTRIDFTQFTTTTQPFEIEQLGLAAFSRRVVEAEKVVIDPALALSIALVNREESA